MTSAGFGEKGIFLGAEKLFAEKLLVHEIVKKTGSEEANEAIKKDRLSRLKNEQDSIEDKDMSS